MRTLSDFELEQTLFKLAWIDLPRPACIFIQNLNARSIAGMPSSPALVGFHLTAHHLCAFLM